MSDTFKTPALFAADLSPMPAGKPAFRWHYPDIASMPTWSRTPDGAWDNTAWSSSRQRGATVSEGIQMARLGWPEGAQQAREMHAGMMAAVPTKRRLARFGIAGAVPSVPRALAGNPLHMRQLAMRETAQRPIISLVCNTCTPFDLSPEAMMAHAVAVAGVVDFLEESGFRCDVLSVARFQDTIACEIATRLKAPEQPLNLAVMAYGLGHPTFLRRLTFAILQSDRCARPLGSGLGWPDSSKPMPEHGTFTIGAAQRFGYHATAAQRFSAMLASLQAQGCPGIPETAEAA